MRGIFTAPGVLSYTSTNCVAPLNIVSTGIREGVWLGERREEKREDRQGRRRRRKTKAISHIKNKTHVAVLVPIFCYLFM